MSIKNQVIKVLSKELSYDWRHFSQLSGLIAFLLGSTYIVFFFMGETKPGFWNLCFWLIMMFLSFFSGSRSFEEDQTRYRHYNHQIGSPFVVFWSKVLYLWFSLFIFCTVLLMLFNILVPITHGFSIYWLLLLSIICLGFALITGFNSFLASLGQGRQVLIIIMTMPICFPLIGMAYSIGLQILTHGSSFNFYKLVLPIIAIDMIALALTSFLLPLVWKS